MVEEIMGLVLHFDNFLSYISLTYARMYISREHVCMREI